MIDRNLLFKPNNHSSFEIRWRPLSAEVFALVADIAHTHYGIEDIVGIAEVDEWEQNSNNFRVSSASGSQPHELLIRKHIRVSDPVVIESIEDGCAHLDSKGVRVSRIVPSRDGSLTVLKDGVRWSASAFLSGNHFAGSAEELKEIGSEVARLVVGLRDYPTKIDRLVTSEWNLERLKHTLILMKDLSNELKTLVEENQERFLGLAKNAEEIHGAHKEHMQLLHNDLHPFNTLFENGRLQAIIDFDNMRYGDFRIDIALALHRFVRQHVVWSGDQSKTRIAAGVKMFLDAYQTVEVLSRKHIESFPLFIRESLFRKMSFDLYRLLESGDRVQHVAEAKKFLILLEESVILEPYIHAYARA